MSNLREPAAPAVIAGSFADYRLIKSRSVLQLVIEIPVEAQAVAFDALGYPMPGIEIPVAVARLNPASPHDAGERPLSVTRPVQRGVIHMAGCATYCGQPECYHGSYDDGPEMFRCSKSTGQIRKIGIQQPRGDGTAALTPKARYAAMTAGEQAVQRAAMLPQDERFRAWATEQRYGDLARLFDEAGAAAYIRDICCGGNSRSRIAENPEAMDRFIALETAFKIAVGEIAEPR